MKGYWFNKSTRTHSIVTFGAWTLVGLLLASQAWVSYRMRGETISWWLPVGIWFSWAYIWALLTPFVAKLVEKFPLQSPKLWLATMIHLVAGLFFSAVNLAIFALIAPLVGSINLGVDWFSTFEKLLNSTFLLNLPVYWLIVGVTFTLKLYVLANEREKQTLTLEKQLSDAKLLTLRDQLQPHFLFNTLNTVSIMMREDVEVANQVLLQLSGLLRRAIDTSTRQKIQLSAEIEFLVAYLEIEKVRFSGQLHYTIDIDHPLGQAYIPSLILQPLVENSVQHGLSNIDRSGEIRIRGFKDDKKLVLMIQDNGIGMTHCIDDGVGLSNTRARLKLLYGNHHSFELTSQANDGILITLTIPLELELTP